MLPILRVRSIFCVLFLSFVILSCLGAYFFLPWYCFYVFFLMFHIFFICFLLILTTIIHHPVLLICLQRNNSASLNNSWLLFSASFLFLKFWFYNKTNNIKLRLFVPPANNYLLKVNKRNTRKRCEICSRLTIKTPGRRP